MTQSEQLFSQAQQSIPGGVNSPVRAFKGVGGTPRFFKSAQGAYLTDADDNTYIDYVGSWGPMILGHGHPEVLDAVKSACDQGLSFGAPTALETEMAEAIKSIVPSIDLVRMVNSGTEATMSAIRLARGYTGRDKIVKFEGCYHGHADSLLVKAGSGALTLGVPSSAGVPKNVAQDTITLRYNDSEQVSEIFRKCGDTIACIIVEPVAGNMNCIPPSQAFLDTLRETCDQHGTVLIFDEVMTGFRVALGGAQSIYNIRPDLTTFGKVIGGGMPVGAYGGKREIMEQIAPTGPVYQAGTLSGNPIAMTAGLKTLQLIQKTDFYKKLETKIATLCKGFEAAASSAGIPAITQSMGAMFGLFFTDQITINSFEEVSRCDTERFNRFFHAMLEEGVYLAPSAYEAGFVSSAHSDKDIEKTISAAERAMQKIK